MCTVQLRISFTTAFYGLYAPNAAKRTSTIAAAGLKPIFKYFHRSVFCFGNNIKSINSLCCRSMYLIQHARRLRLIDFGNSRRMGLDGGFYSNEYLGSARWASFYVDLSKANQQVGFSVCVDSILLFIFISNAYFSKHSVLERRCFKVTCVCSFNFIFVLTQMQHAYTLRDDHISAFFILMDGMSAAQSNLPWFDLAEVTNITTACCIYHVYLSFHVRVILAVIVWLSEICRTDNPKSYIGVVFSFCIFTA